MLTGQAPGYLYGLAYSRANKQRQDRTGQDRTGQVKTGCETAVGASRRRMSRDTTWQPHAIGSCLVGWVISDHSALSQPHQIKQGGPDQHQNRPQAASYRRGARENMGVGAVDVGPLQARDPGPAALPKPRMCLF